MSCHSPLFFDKMLDRAEAFSGNLSNLPIEKLSTIKSNNLNKSFIPTMQIWDQGYFRSQIKK